MTEPASFRMLDAAATAADAALTATATVWATLDDEQRAEWIDSRRDRVPDVVTFLPRLLGADPEAGLDAELAARRLVDDA
jgi:hypothetical protein